MEPNQSAKPNIQGQILLEREFNEIMTRLGEIDQKVEHIIENIHDSLYRLQGSGEEDSEDAQ